MNKFNLIKNIKGKSSNKSYLIMVVIVLFILLVSLYSSFGDRVIQDFENGDSEFNVLFHNPWETDSTFIRFNRGECVAQANMTIRGDLATSEVGIPADIVLITDLSGSMDGCISDDFIIDEYVSSEAECDSIASLSEKYTSGTFDPDSQYRYTEEVTDSIFYDDIELNYISRCDDFGFVSSCSTPYCYGDCNYSRVANCGGAGLGFSVDVCCSGSASTCCSGDNCGCEFVSREQYISNQNCNPTLWVNNNLTYCREYCSSGQWSVWTLGQCPLNEGVEVWNCTGTSGCTSIPTNPVNYCSLENRYTSGMTENDFILNCSNIPNPTYANQGYTLTCNNYNCNNSNYYRCYSHYVNWNQLNDCSEQTKDGCISFNTDDGPVFYEFDRLLRAYTPFHRSCSQTHVYVRWPTVEEGKDTYTDCIDVEDVYSCRQKYWDTDFDDSTWSSTKINNVDDGWGNCNRCSVIYRQDFILTQDQINTFNNITFRVGSDDGALCYINNRSLHYDNLGHGFLQWNFDLTIPRNQIASYLKSGNNVLSCQIKDYTSAEGFDAELYIDSTELISSRSTWNTKLLTDFCGANSGRPYRYDPDHNSCEDFNVVDSCEGYYPYNSPGFKPMNVTGVIYGIESQRGSDYEDGIKRIGTILAENLKGEYINDYAGVSGPGYFIDPSFWDSADVLIVDSHNHAGWYVEEIKTAAFNGKIVIIDNRLFNSIYQSFIIKPELKNQYSYDLRTRYFDYGSGKIIGSLDTNYLGYYWRRDSSLYSSCIFCDKEDTAANLFNTIYPIWYSGDDSSYECNSTQYCIAGIDNKNCKGCTTLRYKLAKELDNIFIDKVLVDNSLGNLGLVNYGSLVGSTSPLTDWTQRDSLKNEVNLYDATLGWTCISCAIFESLELIPEDNSGRDQFIVLMSDGEANRCRTGPSSSSDCGINNAVTQAVDFACDTNNPDSAVSRGIKVFTVAFGMEPNNIPPPQSDYGNYLLWKVANCTNGKFYSGTSVDALTDVYVDIATIVTSGSPTPIIDVASDGNDDYTATTAINGQRTWHNDICAGANCNDLSDALNVGITDCYINNVDPCDVDLQVTSSTVGNLTLKELNVFTVDIPTAPIIVPDSGLDIGQFTCDGVNLPECGNGELETGEECDDDNLVDGDGCDSSCHLEISPGCGDGAINGGEACDDNGANSNDPNHACRLNCLNQKCGDNIIDNGAAYGSEVCDYGSYCNLDHNVICTNNPGRCPANGLGNCVPRNINRCINCNKVCYPMKKDTYTNIDFDPINLNKYVFDPDTNDLDLIWAVAGENHLTVNINNLNVADVAVPKNGWNGSEELLFTVTDPDGNWDQICFNLTVIEVPNYNLTDPGYTRLLIPKGTLISNYYEDTLTGNITRWGPYYITVKVWEKNLN